MISEATRDRLMSDVKSLMSDADEIVKSMATATGEKAAELGEKLRVNLRNAREKMGDMQVAVTDQAKAAARATDDFVHERPWTAVGIGVGVGILLGLLINRR
jgi:ElaB/YqjD/DUF883 family membrane-anchored ribosome-binding protein